MSFVMSDITADSLNQEFLSAQLTVIIVPEVNIDSVTNISFSPGIEAWEQFTPGRVTSHFASPHTNAWILQPHLVHMNLLQLTCMYTACNNNRVPQLVHMVCSTKYVYIYIMDLTYCL